MIYSKPISDAILKKWSCIKQIKNIASCYLFCREKDLLKMNEVLQMIENKGFTLPNMVYGKVYRSYNIIFIFTEPEELVLEKINNMVPVVTKKVDTPEKVIAKMIALRLVKLHKHISEWNTLVSKYPGSTYYTYTIPAIVKSDLNNKFTAPHYSNIRKKDVDDIKKLLSRKEVTEKAVNDAWDIYSVHEIMDS